MYIFFFQERHIFTCMIFVICKPLWCRGRRWWMQRVLKNKITPGPVLVRAPGSDIGVIPAWHQASYLGHEWHECLCSQSQCCAKELSSASRWSDPASQPVCWVAMKLSDRPTPGNPGGKLRPWCLRGVVSAQCLFGLPLGYQGLTGGYSTFFQGGKWHVPKGSSTASRIPAVFQKQWKG